MKKQTNPAKVKTKMVTVESIVVERKSKGFVPALAKSIEEQLKDAPEQAAVQVDYCTRSIYQSLRNMLSKKFNLAFNKEKSIAWIWKGI